MKAQLSHTEIFIKACHVFHKFFGCFCAGQKPAQSTETVFDSFIKLFPTAWRIFIVADKPAAGPGAVKAFKSRKIQMKQVFKNTKVMKGKVV